MIIHNPTPTLKKKEDETWTVQSLNEIDKSQSLSNLPPLNLNKVGSEASFGHLSP